jgi:hypothetical protein
MRNEQRQSHPRTRRTSTAARRDDLADWRCLTRPVILADVLNRTLNLRWSRELIDLLLDELHVSDEFDDLIGRVPPSAQVNYPQLVALALILRHSWFPQDLARILAEPGLAPSPTPPTGEPVPSPEAIDAANRRGLTSHAAPPRQTGTPQKGEEQRC